MMNKGSRKKADSVTLFSYVGNMGCIRFPEKIRKVSGIKRDDRLVVTVRDQHTIVLEKLDIPQHVSLEKISGLRVEKCSCAEPPESCRQAELSLVKVGWSYVELEESLAVQMGFTPSAPIKLVGEPSRISVSLHKNRRDLKGVEPVICPP
jgi:bifunctional DNA-binding transcriptional regulator/antitoxin component of YhaV-PrlF toxin-antitoxin module